MATQIEAKLKPKPLPVPISWQRTSFDPVTGLPDRPMFDANLRLMLAEGAKTDLTSGLLLVTIDRREQLKSRFGIRGVDDLDKSVAAVIGRAIRKAGSRLPADGRLVSASCSQLSMSKRGRNWHKSSEIRSDCTPSASTTSDRKCW